ncbi:peptidase dimerization domain-containing protein, partial [Arthrospira platensis SPKY1]|nr:peptidase dimerization domain-containing protein [Arthrospira platensis SPKY1]
IGCAGGIDTNTSMSYDEQPTPADSKGYQIAIRGLKGGHSGIEIHLGRANANKLMTRLLYRMGRDYGMSISSIDGGSLRNAIPREATAIVAVPSAQSKAFETEFAR